LVPEKKPEKPQQQQTLSVRISEALRTRLEQARLLVSKRTGESVSTSEIAKQLLESAREDRLEVVDMLVDPAEALLQIRRKGEAQHVLTRAEWTVVAHFVQQGLEAFSGETPNPVSRESLGDVLDAFLAVYELRSDQRASKRDEYYLGNLPRECRPGKAKTSDDGMTSDTVRRTVMETRKRLSERATNFEPLLAGRNLLALLEDEKLSGADAVDRALRPFWPGLWRLAARGHYHLIHQPVRIKPSQRDSFFQTPIAPIREGEYTLSFARGEGHDFSLLLSFPGPRGPMYPFSGYSKIGEFRRMLGALTPESSTPRWNGVHFFAYTAKPEDEKEKGQDFWFRAHDNGITFGFAEKEWKSVQALFRRAWEVQEVRMAWDGLALEYGEL
jgi:hypothetical protein